MKKLGFLILAIITALACSLGTLGCGKEKEKELNMLDYFENQVDYALYTTDESSKYYDAEKGYGIIPGINTDLLLYTEEVYRRGLTTDIGHGGLEKYSIMRFTPKTNVNEIYVRDIRFTVETDIDCTLKLYFFGTVGLNEVPSGTKRLEVVCKAYEPQEVNCIELNFGWLKEEAQNESWAKRKNICMALENMDCGASYTISNLEFYLRKA